MVDEDKIILYNMEFLGHHGVLPFERPVAQRFEVDVELGLDLAPAMASDALRDTVDYRQAYAIVREEVEDHHYQLLEALAGAMVRRLLADLSVSSVRVRVRKPQVPLEGILS